jgi:hypothetical protein
VCRWFRIRFSISGIGVKELEPITDNFSQGTLNSAAFIPASALCSSRCAIYWSDSYSLSTSRRWRGSRARHHLVGLH